MQSIFSNALSRAVAKHIDLSVTRRETLSWLTLLIMQHGTICLWRLAAYVASMAQTDSVRRRFYRFFQFVRLDSTLAARVVVELLGLGGKPWVLAIDRTNCDFGKNTTYILRISGTWEGLGIHDETLSSPVRLVVMRLASGELLALACSGSARHALARYRQRWTIETMFGNLKTKGFALEATHLTDPDKLCTLLALLAFAVALTVKTGVAMARLHPIPVKNHGRRARSLFALGLHTLRKIFVAASPAQIIAFLGQLLSPKLPVKPLLALAFR